MYAIIENGGKQYKAVEGGFIEIDLLPDEVGKKKTFDKVLLLSTDGGTEVGTPYLKDVSVDTTVISHFKAPKIIVFKYRAKQRYRVKTGHRQKYSRVLIDTIAFPGKSAAAKKSTDTSTSKKAAPVKAVKSATAAAKKNTSTKVKSTTSKKPVASSAKKSTSSKAKTTAKKTAATKETAKKTVSKKPTASSTKKPTTSKAKITAKKTAASKTTADKKTNSADKK